MLFTPRPAGSIVALLVSALFLSACEGGSGAPSTSAPPVVTETETAPPVTATDTPPEVSPSPTTPAQPTTSPTPTALPPLGNPSLDQKQLSPVGEFDMSIANIRVAEHESFTRVVIDIAASQSTPGWWIDWTTEPVQQASGLPVDVSGDSFLDVNIEGIGYPDQASVPSIENGPYPGAGIVEDINLTSIFEARAQILIGVSGPPRSYSVTLLEEPSRVVIDIIH